jgi:hypothetical protein
MKKLLISFLACALLSAVPVQARSPVPLVELENQSIAAASGKALTLEDVARALRQAAPKRGWTITETASGKAVAMLEVRGKHTIKLDVDYTASRISFHYKDSENMKYGKDEEGHAVIHPFYMKWVANLLSDVRIELGRF